MEIYLGVVSFVNFLKEHRRSFSLMGTDLSLIVLYLPGTQKDFEITCADRDPKDCGFIPVNDETLMNIFGQKEYNAIIRECRKMYKNEQNLFIPHCAVSLDPNKIGKLHIEIPINDKEIKAFYCHL